MSHQEPGKYSYCIVARNPDAFVEFDSEADITRKPDLAAREAGEHFYYDGGGNAGDFPLVIRIRDGHGKVVGDYRIELIKMLSFVADRVKDPNDGQ